MQHTISVADLAKILSIHPAHCSRMARLGRIKAVRLPGPRTRYRIPVDEARRVAATVGIDFDSVQAKAKP